MNSHFSVLVCASGGGGNFQALINAQSIIGFSIHSLIVDRPCGAVQCARAAGISVVHVRNTTDHLCHDLDNAFSEHINLVVLAGFMPIIPITICEKWYGKMINTHPSLLPKYGGKGMYGVKVQEAVMQGGEKFAGCTIHYVNSEIDGGDIIMQESIEIDYNETPWQLGGRVFELENKLLVQAVSHCKQIARFNQVTGL